MRERIWPLVTAFSAIFFFSVPGRKVRSQGEVYREGGAGERKRAEVPAPDLGVCVCVCVCVYVCVCTGLFLTVYFFLLWFSHKEKEYIWEKKVEKPFSFPYNPSTNLLLVCLNFLASVKYSINL